MELVTIPTEQTTAATDLLVAVTAIASVFVLQRSGSAYRRKIGIWSGVFVLLAIAALLGAVAHGIDWSDATRTLIWYPLYLTLGLMVALFVVATLYDVRGERSAMRALPLMLVTGLLFFGITLLWPNDFQAFILYEAAAMLFALAGYGWLAWQGRPPGSFLIAAGILLSVIAAAVQAGSLLTLSLIWEFDHNGVYHLIQIAGITLIVAGLGRSMSRR